MRAAGVRDGVVDRARSNRDERVAKKVAAKRIAARKRLYRQAARMALIKSHLRFQGRRLLAAAVAAAVGLVGALTTPVGQRLGISWLQHPGRRIYRQLMARARAARDGRDSLIRGELAEQEKRIDEQGEADEVGDTAERPNAGGTNHMDSTDGFRFEEYAAEMEQAAASYDPDGAMEILTMIEGLPTAFLSIANTMKLLAERSDDEFPFEKEVADAFNDVFAALTKAVDAAESVGQTFRQVHEQDIARHEDPRGGPEAEKKWNV